MLALTFLSGIILFILAYRIYGSILVKKFDLKKENKTPSCTMQDNVDYCPTKAPVLLGHHFSSIAG
ncbi:MAG: carbon starvation protein A, partial [Spirochaetes bacterium]|nr:carbon starvation protein A [Spirochaetota bacterium]